MVKASGNTITVNGGTVGYIKKTETGWVAKEYLHRAEGIVMEGKAKKKLAEAYAKAWLAK